MKTLFEKTLNYDVWNTMILAKKKKPILIFSSGYFKINLIIISNKLVYILINYYYHFDYK